MMKGRCSDLRGGSALLAVALACGPVAPGETTGSGGSSSTDATATSSGTATGGPSTGSGAATGEPATGGAVTGTDTAMTETGAMTTDTATTGAASSSGGFDDTGVCIADPAKGICSESCDYWNDCCQCEGKTLTPMGATECTIAMGIVTARCPWSLWGVRLDGKSLDPLFACSGMEPGWTSYPQDGDIVVELCGDTCAAYLAGAFATLELEMFCEVA